MDFKVRAILHTEPIQLENMVTITKGEAASFDLVIDANDFDIADILKQTALYQITVMIEQPLAVGDTVDYYKLYDYSTISRNGMRAGERITIGGPRAINSHFEFIQGYSDTTVRFTLTDTETAKLAICDVKNPVEVTFILTTVDQKTIVTRVIPAVVIGQMEE